MDPDDEDKLAFLGYSSENLKHFEMTNRCNIVMISTNKILGLVNKIDIYYRYI